MTEARQASEWDHTASLLALLTNAFSSADTPRIPEIEFNQYRRKSKPAAKKQGMNDLKCLFDG